MFFYHPHHSPSNRKIYAAVGLRIRYQDLHHRANGSIEDNLSLRKQSGVETVAADAFKSVENRLSNK